MSCEKVPIFFRNIFEAGMRDSEYRIYRFQSFVLNVGERQLFNGDRTISLTPKTFDVLVHLVENAGHLVHKDDLMKAVWPNAFVEEVNIPRSVYQLRKSLGQNNNGNRFIETVPTKGYRFTMPVVRDDTEVPDGSLPKAEDNLASIEFAESSGDAATVQEKKGSVPLIMSRPILVVGFIAVFLVLGAFWYRVGIPAPRMETNGQAPPTSNNGAYRLYLEGKFILDRSFAAEGEEARAKFEESLKLDPTFSLAYAGRADAEWRIFHGPTRTHDDIARTRASISKALTFDPNNSYAHALQCRIYTTYDWDFSSAEKACRRAIELDPRNPEARLEFAMFLNQFARHDEALEEVDAAIALAPTSYKKHQRAIILFFAKRYREAIEQLEQVYAADPKFQKYPSGFLWWSYAMDRDYDKAADLYINPQEWPEHADAGNELRSIYSAQGWTGFQNAVVRQYQPGAPRSVLCAAMHCQMGNKNETFEFLEAALKNRELWMIHLMADPRFEPCRDDPRFDELMSKIGIEG